jgi:hypothetical protein
MTGLLLQCAVPRDLLQVAEAALLPTLKIVLHSRETTVFERQSYISLLARVFDNPEESTKAFALLGTPGIGKSVAGYYLMWWWLRESSQAAGVEEPPTGHPIARTPLSSSGTEDRVVIYHDHRGLFAFSSKFSTQVLSTLDIQQSVQVSVSRHWNLLKCCNEV